MWHHYLFPYRPVSLSNASRDLFLGHLGFKVFYIRFTNSRATLTPSNVHRKFSVWLNRFTLISRL